MSLSIMLKPAVVLALLLSAFSAAVEAIPFSAVVVYGDSLSDNGNLFAATSGAVPGSPYYNGRRSDGPVAVEQLASTLGVPLLDFAWIGATTGIGNYADGGTPTSLGAFSLPGMQAEFAATQASLTSSLLADGLFVVWGGPNDFLSPSPLDLTPQAIVSRAVADILDIVMGLEGLGAHNILVPDMPDLGLTPYFKSLGPAAAAQASALTDGFNALLMASLPADVYFYDTAAAMRAIVADPAAYGFTNATDPCFNGITLCADPSQYVYFDDFHPTTAVDSIAAAGFLTAVVPEPSTITLILGGLLILSISMKRKSHLRIP